jgi:hypothetical protein
LEQAPPASAALDDERDQPPAGEGADPVAASSGPNGPRCARR